MAEETPLVLVTGGSGYIATHVIRLLLRQGHKVRATVRSLRNEVKVKPMRDLCPDAKFPLELVEADLTKDESWIPAVRGCTYVLHLASPFPSEMPQNEDEVIKPAVNGCLAVLKACVEVGGVKRVVLTSTLAAIAGPRVPADKTFTEADWTDLETTEDAYYKSKVLAEKAAWDFVANLSDDSKFDLVVLNPGFVLGPILCGTAGTSMALCKQLMMHEMPMTFKIGFGTIDVRDVALAHVNAMTVPEAVGKRHVLCSQSMWLKDIGLVLEKEFKSQGYNVTTMESPNFVAKFLGLFNKEVHRFVPFLGSLPKFDNSRMQTVLGITPRPMPNAICDMAYSMIEEGHIKKTAKYTGPKFSE